MKMTATEPTGKEEQADSQDEPESEHSDEDEGDSAPLRQVLDSAALKRKSVCFQTESQTEETR